MTLTPHGASAVLGQQGWALSIWKAAAPACRAPSDLCRLAPPFILQYSSSSAPLIYDLLENTIIV